MADSAHRANRRTANDSGERLQKVLAASGVASRRKAEDLIVAGRVRVDGEVVTKLGARIKADQRLEVDGKLIRREPRRYILMHKPSGYITTMDDERGRDTVMQLVDVPERVIPVGRLDRSTEGLMLLTNDGELAYRIMHPSYEIEKEYEVLLDGHPPPSVLDQVRMGITIEGTRVIPTFVRPIRMTEDGTVVRIVIHEGRNRIIRRIFESVDYPVRRLRRIRIGPIQLGAIKRGSWRDMTPGELAQIREAVGITEGRSSYRGRRSRGRSVPSRRKSGTEKRRKSGTDRR